MTQRDIEILHDRMRSQAEQLDRIEELARNTNGRVKALELWRAKWQGAEFTSRFIGLVAVGVIGAVVLDLIR